MKKTLSASIFIAITTLAFAQPQWLVQDSNTTANNHLSCIAALTSNKVWVVGNNGWILNTTDGGLIWNYQSNPLTSTTENINALYFKDTVTGIAVATHGKVIKTNNAGNTWGLYPSGVTTSLNGLTFISGKIFACGDTGTILKSSDLGSTWTSLTSSTSQNLNAITFIDSLNGWCVGENGTLLKTSNGGATWSSNNFNFGVWNKLIKIMFFDQQIGLLIGEQSTGSVIFRTTDGGVNWNQINPFGASFSTLLVAGLKKIDANSCYAVGGCTNTCAGGPGPFAISTHDKGATWNLGGTAPTSNYAYPTDLDFIDSNTIFMAGRYEYIWRYDNTLINIVLTNNTLCPLVNYQIPYTANGTYNHGNKFIVELITTNFPSGYTIDSITSSSNTGFIPLLFYPNIGTPTSMRIRSTNPISISTTFAVQSSTSTSSFSASPTALTGPFTTTFTNSSINASSYLWNFGDGQTSNSGNASVYHTYTCDGTFDISLVTQSALGCPDTLIRQGYIYVNGTGHACCTATSANISKAICNGQSFTIGASTFSSAGNYSATLVNAGGCDSIVHLTLTVHNLPNPTITNNGGTLYTGNFTHYQWLRNGASLAGDTLSSFIPTLNGIYAVSVTDSNGCIATSASDTISNLGIEDVSFNKLVVAPNPTEKMVNVIFDNYNYNLEIYDLLGKAIRISNNLTGNIQVSLHELNSGMYIFRIVTAKGVAVRRILKE